MLPDDPMTSDDHTPARQAHLRYIRMKVQCLLGDALPPYTRAAGNDQRPRQWHSVSGPSSELAVVDRSLERHLWTAKSLTNENGTARTGRISFVIEWACLASERRRAPVHQQLLGHTAADDAPTVAGTAASADRSPGALETNARCQSVSDAVAVQNWVFRCCRCCLIATTGACCASQRDGCKASASRQQRPVSSAL